MRRVGHLRTSRFLQIALASVAMSFATVADAQSTDAADPPPTLLQAMFIACIAPDAPMTLRIKVVQDAGWQPATADARTKMQLAEQLAVQTNRGNPPQSWASVLGDAASRASAIDSETRLYIVDGDVPSLLAIRPDPTSDGVTCGYSASNSTPEALQLLLNVGKEPDTSGTATLTIRSALTVRAMVKDDTGRSWQVTASSHFADPIKIAAETGKPFSTAFALTIALHPADS